MAGNQDLDAIADAIEREKLTVFVGAGMSAAVQHTVAPLTCAGWRELLESQGLRVCAEFEAPMHLLEPKRMIADEGLMGTLRFARNLLMDREARRHVRAMREVFRKFEHHLTAIMLVGVKPEAEQS